jgi:hypothetical protein
LGVLGGDITGYKISHFMSLSDILRIGILNRDDYPLTTYWWVMVGPWCPNVPDFFSTSKKEIWRFQPGKFAGNHKMFGE